MKLSVTISGLSRLFGRDLAGLVDLARVADALGIDSLVMPDHLAIGPRLDRYPYGRFPYPPDEPWLEPLTTLATLAGATRRLRLGTGVLLAPLRPPLLLAKTLATLDVLSGGRLDLGVGLGWQPEEFTAAGVPFAGRGRRLDDTLRACRALWRDGGLDDLRCLPRPVQPGGIPIWFGGALGERNVARIVELGAGWLPPGHDLAQLRSGVARLREAFARAGRDPASLGVRANARVATPEALAELEAAGATVSAVPLDRLARDSDDLRPCLERLARLSPPAPSPSRTAR